MTSFFLWYLQESNQGHTDFQSVALPSELRYPHQSPQHAERGGKSSIFRSISYPKPILLKQ